ncbi:phenylacetate--CoA ligase family protein [Aliivibrio finisterrensis]|uniref:Phenylacetate--CoA ligase family protein n=1 Tax=Aliivibrio finisterrensis TaxID=511998 RepID=A0A4V1Z7Q0_9GAMM|nr:phenylacetate--CoA ligase family protein [Aliivibrio finisterrensis]RYU46111.1 phenylacetate--CoA ligase family protein [Aliivibrio finisterrensis]
MFTSFVYQKSPVPIQNGLLSCRSLIRKILREGKNQSTLLSDIQKNEFDASAMGSFVDTQLTHTLTQATKHVPFYKHAMVSPTHKLADFPIINKSDIREKGDDFLADNHRGVIVSGATSGTTGTPLVIKQNMTSVVREQAFVARHLDWAGFKSGDKRAWIRGDMIVPLSQKKGPFWRYSWFENMIMLSSFHMSPNNLQHYIDAMADYGVEIIQAYPSSVVTLAKHLDIHDQYYSGKLKSIVTSSESLSQEDKQLIEKRFGCVVFDWYGLFERVAAIGSCEHGRYHILSDYSHVELIDVGDGRHEIIGTNFNNSLQPLIRYRTGDHVYLSNETACPCGRTFPLIDRIEGRIGDYLLGEDGQKVHILNHIPKGVTGLIATQFIQNEPKQIEVQAVVNKDLFDEQQEHILIENTKERLGQSMDVFVTTVDQIQKTKNGKTRQAICSI